MAGFNGNGDYEINNAGSYSVDGYQNIGDFASDTEYILKNVVLTVNGTYEFVLKDTGYTWLDNGVYKLGLGSIYYQPESVVYTSKDGKATLKYDGSLIALYVSDTTQEPGGDDVSEGEMTEVQTSANAETKVRAMVIPETTADKDYNKAAISVECASDTSFNEHAVLHIVITVNGVETDIEQKGIGGWDSGWSGTYDITDKFPAIKTGDVYKVEAYTDSWEAHTESYVFKVGAALAYEKADDVQEPDDVQKPEKVKTEITSAKIAFGYEKAAEGIATYLKVCNAEVSGFNGLGDYEVEIAEAEWSTWDKTGFYNLGFIESDTEYTLKNVILTVNGTYEFVLGESKSSEFKEEKYKVDFPNCWNEFNKGDVLFTSKDGKAEIVFEGQNAVMSLYVESDATPTPTPTRKPSRPSYVVPVATPTAEPTVSPTTGPTAAPTATPTAAPTAAPTVKPTETPATEPTVVPTIVPTAVPTIAPTAAPTAKPTEASAKPTAAPAGEKVQKGDKVTVSGQKYVVTSTAKKTVEYTAAKNSKKTSVSVPATVKVTVNGKKVTYKVTSIKDKAFKGDKKLKKVTVSKNIKSIGRDAFKNCGNLKTIVIKSSSLTKVGKDALKGTAKNLVIKVPAKKVSAYKKLFKNKGNNSVVVKKA